MQSITFDQQVYRRNDVPFYLNSGEFPYFRVPRADWQRRMELFLESGGNCLATYVPWVVHEPEEGRFTFGEREFDDLVGFLDTARAAGLHVIARPGPYQYTEFLYAGLPHWLCRDYPAILARDRDGNVLHYFSVSYLHPAFLDKARRWFRRVGPLLAAHTATNGGPIAFVQVDNELGGIHEWFGGPDYNAEAMGFGRPDGRYPEFLRRRYGDIATLNRACGLNVSAFEQVPPPVLRGNAGPEELRRRKDYFEFYLGVLAEYARLLADWLREEGVGVPIVHNAANPSMNSFFLETIQAMEADFLLGSDHYYSLGQGWEQNNPTPQYARKCFVSLEMLRLMGYPPTVFELPGGSPACWPPITPQDAAACYFLNLAYGMRGHNYYIFTGGPNPPRLGQTTDLYDYGAAVGADGQVRPLYEVQKRFGIFVRDRPWLVRTEREFDVRYALDWHGTRSQRYWQERGVFSLTTAEAWDLLLTGPLTTTLCLGFSPVFCDPGREDPSSAADTPLVIVASAAMPRTVQEWIVAFLEAGGKALILPVLPDHDETWRPCSPLASYLGSPLIRGAGASPSRLCIAGAVNVQNNGEVFHTESLPVGAEILGTDELRQTPVCWSRRNDQGGEAVFLGLKWAHTTVEHGHMLHALLTRLGARRKVEASNPDVWTSLRTAGDRSVLFLMNLFSAPLATRVVCRPSWSTGPVDTGLHELAPMEVKCIELSRNGTNDEIPNGEEHELA